jgi:hypothetical protein
MAQGGVQGSGGQAPGAPAVQAAGDQVQGADAGADYDGPDDGGDDGGPESGEAQE